MRLDITPTLKEKILELREQQLRANPDELLTAEPVVKLLCDLWTEYYLDIWGHMFEWNHEKYVFGSTAVDKSQPQQLYDQEEIICVLILSAEKLSLPQLLELIPKTSSTGVTCQQCLGKRRIEMPMYPLLFLCPACKGLGWVEP